ncbi:hypothetical protein U9M48_000390 [Paspalum notatum var. saurae]|uniref:Uncharacterized protein n=1 Tax=Paspalum notatum var. saurae TaxID=547442 RepID=A0AAQ3SHE4_PASNO
MPLELLQPLGYTPFGHKHIRRDVSHPFGDAVVDGIDFYVDKWDDHYYGDLARRLHGYKYNDKPAATGSKRAVRRCVRLTATPRCPYPADHQLPAGLFGRIHVRFYGDEDWCSYKTGGVDGIVE